MTSDIHDFPTARPPAWPWLAIAGIVILLLAATVRCFAQPEIVLLGISTNHPVIDFTAATPLGSFPNTAYFHTSNDCQTVTFSVSGLDASKVYDLQWNYALGNPATNSTGGIEGHTFCNVWPAITNRSGTVTVVYPAKPSPNSFWRIKQR